MWKIKLKPSHEWMGFILVEATSQGSIITRNGKQIIKSTKIGARIAQSLSRTSGNWKGNIRGPWIIHQVGLGSGQHPPVLHLSMWLRISPSLSYFLFLHIFNLFLFSYGGKQSNKLMKGSSSLTKIIEGI